MATYQRTPGFQGPAPSTPPGMYYQNSTGLWVPVTGTPGTGKVPTVQADNSVSWQTPSGGGGGSTPQWVTDHPDTAPASPAAFNHEFLTGDTIGGTTLGSPATAPVITDNQLLVTGGTSGSADLKGVAWTMPSTPYTIFAKIGIASQAINYSVTGIGWRSAANKIRRACIFLNAGNQHDWWWQADYYTSLTARSSFTPQLQQFAPVAYVKLTDNGTTLTADISSTGRGGTWRNFINEARTVSFTGGDLPTDICFTVDSFSGGPCVGWCEFLRSI